MEKFDNHARDSGESMRWNAYEELVDLHEPSNFPSEPEVGGGQDTNKPLAFTHNSNKGTWNRIRKLQWQHILIVSTSALVVLLLVTLILTLGNSSGNPGSVQGIDSSCKRLQALLTDQLHQTANKSASHQSSKTRNIKTICKTSANETLYNVKALLSTLEAKAVDDDLSPEVINQLDIDCRDNITGNTALHLASQFGYMSEVRFLTKYGADVNTKNKLLQAPLHLATVGNDIEFSFHIIKFLIQHEADVFLKDRFGNTFLHKLLDRNDTGRITLPQFDDLVVALIGLENGHIFDIQGGKRKQTPLQQSVQNLELDQETLFLLHSNQVNFSAVDGDSNSVLMYALQGQRSVPFLSNLTSYGANWKGSDKNHENVLHLAIKSGYGKDAIGFLLSKGGLNVNLANVDGDTPLHFAARYGQTDKVLEMVELLLDSGTKRSTINIKNQTAYDILLKRNETEVIPAELLEITKEKPTDCDQIRSSGFTQSGIYRIYVKNSKWENNGTDVFCDLATDNKGWIVMQRRQEEEPQPDFYRNWQTYADGFGSLMKSHWLGLDVVSAITNNEAYELRIDLEDWDGQSRFAEYKVFNVANAANRYKLTVGNYSGNAGDSLTYHNRQYFSTKDRDNDGASSTDCAKDRVGAWWFESCSACHLNGPYRHSGNHNIRGIRWDGFRGTDYSLKKSEMKIRPVVRSN